jgi:hypothetical protein
MPSKISAILTIEAVISSSIFKVITTIPHAGDSSTALGGETIFVGKVIPLSY